MNPPPSDLCIATLATTWGAISITAGVRGVRSCQLPRPSRRAAGGALRVRGLRLPEGAPMVLRRAVAYAHSVVEGRAPGSCPRLDPEVFDAASPFRRAVWRALREIPRGGRLTYGELARRVGRPGAARAAGGACGANPLPLFLPCHRVVAAGGRPGGFSAGPAWKPWLLAREGCGR